MESSPGLITLADVLPFLNSAWILSFHFSVMVQCKDSHIFYGQNRGVDLFCIGGNQQNSQNASLICGLRWAGFRFCS